MAQKRAITLNINDIIPKISLTVINQIIPSKSRVKISPGNLIVQPLTVSKTSSIKLFFKNRQDEKVKDEIAKAM